MTRPTRGKKINTTTQIFLLQITEIFFHAKIFKGSEWYGGRIKAEVVTR